MGDSLVIDKKWAPIVRDRVQGMVKKKMTLDQVKAARPTLEYDPRYGSNVALVEAIYQNLNVTPPPAPVPAGMRPAAKTEAAR